MVRFRGTPLRPGVKLACKDRYGRLVTLTEERWEHIVAGHPAMDGFELAVKNAVERADEEGKGNGPNIEVTYGRNMGPARWLAVVVAYERPGEGFILTAYPQTKEPKVGDLGKEPPQEVE